MQEIPFLRSEIPHTLKRSMAVEILTKQLYYSYT